MTWTALLSIASFVLSIIAVVLAYFALVFVEDDTDGDIEEWDHHFAQSRLTPEQKADLFKRIAANIQAERNHHD